MNVVRETRQPEGHIRPLNPFRDLDAVVDLISLAFGERLDPAGKATLIRMRRFARSGPLLQWVWALLGRATVAPGLVWVVDGRVVGNVSVRRARGSNGCLIGNVVVHPDWRGQGIASALMKRAIKVVYQRGASWVGLEVRLDNDMARGMYERLGFREVGRTRHLLRASGSSEVKRASRPDLMRRGRPGDGDALVRLMKAVIPEPQRPLLEIQEDDYQPGWERRIEHWLRCENEIWWIVEGRDRAKECNLGGAVRSVRRRGAFPNQMEVLVRPGRNARLEVDLVRQGVVTLGGSPNKPIEISLPEARDSLVEALQGEGFEELRVLVQMRRTLRHRVPVHRKL